MIRLHQDMEPLLYVYAISNHLAGWSWFVVYGEAKSSCKTSNKVNNIDTYVYWVWKLIEDLGTECS